MKNLKNKKFIISISILMLLQAAIYWSIKLLQSDYHTITFFLDDKIPFIKETIYIYNSFYPVVFALLAYLFTKDKRKYYNAVLAGVLGYLICDIVFLSYPTVMTGNRDIIVNSFTDLIVKITYMVDSPALNCCPSIHCLFCFQTIYSLASSKKITKKFKIFSTIYLILIVLSTFTVKQHYVYDAILALIICIIANIITVKFNLLNNVRKLINKRNKENTIQKNE